MKRNAIKTRLFAILSIGIVFGYVGILNFAGNRFFFRADLTENNVYTLSTPTKERLGEIDDIIRIDVFFSENLPPRYQRVRTRVMDMLYEFQRFSHGRIRVEQHDPTTSTDDLSLALALNVEEIRIEDVSARHLAKLHGYSGLAIRYGDRTETLNDISSTVHLERDILQRIINVTTEKLPQVGVVKTDTITPIPDEMVQRYQLQQPSGLTSQRYRNLYDILLETYRVKHLDLSRQSIPDDISTIVIPGGDEATLSSPEFLRELDAFFARGGNAMILAPRLDINLAAMGRQPHVTFKEYPFYALLESYGVSVGETVILDQYCDNIYADQGSVPFKYPYFPVITQDGLNKTHPITSSISGVILQWASPVFAHENAAKEDLRIDTLLFSSEKSFGNTPPIGLAPNQDWDRMFDQAERAGEAPFGPFPLAVSVEGVLPNRFADETAPPPEQENRLVVVGSDNFVTHDGMGLNNRIFIQNSVDWVSRRDDFIHIRSQNITDRRITRDGIPTNSALARRIRTVNIFLLPLIVWLIGIGIFLHRREIESNSLHNKKKSGGTHGE